MRPWPNLDTPALPGKGAVPVIWDSAAQEMIPSADGDTARLYVCGITPYDATHIGHAATYLAFDLLQRAWLDAGLSVQYVQNITDVDDPLLERAHQYGQDWRELADRETARFARDAAALRLLPPDHWVSVSEAMPVIIDYIERLLKAGLAYFVDSDVYFDISKANGFGGISHLPDEKMLELFGQRGGDPQRTGKRNPLDALLWLAQRPNEPAWQSPFGLGRPGWHVECLAIAEHFLGTPISVQGGGSDLLFPHHEYCQAEAEALGHKFSQRFSHVGMVYYEGAKMSKSLGNLVFVDALLGERDAMAVRLAIANQHYRSEWEWTEQHLLDAESRLALWREALATQAGPAAESLLAEFRATLADDLNAPRGFAAMDRWSRAALAGENTQPGAAGLVARALDALYGIAL